MKASPESKIHLSCGHVVRDWDEALFLEITETDPLEYVYACKACAKEMIYRGDARRPNTNSERENTKDG